METSWQMRGKRALAVVKSAIRHPYSFVNYVVLSKKVTDLQRWSAIESLDPEWDERTRLIGGMIPNGSAVIEFGAARLTLPTALGADCRYQPSDIVKRSADTIVMDLNGKLPQMCDIYDYAVLSGVLEYIRDYDALLLWLAKFNLHVVVSYAIADKLEDPITRVRNGWINHLYYQEVIKAMSLAGFEVVETADWREQVIFSCSGPLANRTD